MPQRYFETLLKGWFTYLAWNIDVNTRGPFVKASQRRLGYRSKLIEVSKKLADEGATTAHPLEIKMIVPVAGGPRYDLVHADKQIQRELVERTSALGFPEPKLALTSENSGRIGDTESRDGEILLNHFAGDVPSGDAVDTWKTLADWYARVLNVDNSTLIECTSDAPFLIVNYAVLPSNTLSFLLDRYLGRVFIVSCALDCARWA